MSDHDYDNDKQQKRERDIGTATLVVTHTLVRSSIRASENMVVAVLVLPEGILSLA
ncbi:MAG: hypothetical protein N838_07825 [Thiohalocapsa sp. PB-PSB1]|jgi:hypothetical protein|nr:MAG: hypothetical protein N838_06865 [Thiohalocapsa sp. PB-PSB1]QQO53286.1 MAG: hypothetical protein N838_07825 [Thiohalocapsa sp. PB-PSB1]